MANITLPSNPVNGQTVVIGTRLFQYDSTAGRWKSRVFRVLGDTTVTVPNESPTITASLSEIALDTSGANVSFTYTVSDVDSSVLKVSHSVSGIANSSLATVTHHRANNTVTITAGTEAFTGGQITLTVTDGRNNATDTVDVSSAYPWTFDVDNLTYDNISGNRTLFVNAGAGNIIDIKFKPDGTKLFILDDDDNIYQFSLSTPWDISTLSYDSISWDDGLTIPAGFTFKPDGTRIYVTEKQLSRVYQYDLSTAWDLSSITANHTSLFSVANEGDQASDVAFKTDGTKMYVKADVFDDSIFQYTLSTPWNVGSATYDSKSLYVEPEDASSTFFQFDEQGTKIYVSGISNDSINQYNLSTPWDVSTATYSNKTFYPIQDGIPQGFAIKSDGTKFYLVGGSNDIIFQYSTGL